MQFKTVSNIGKRIAAVLFAAAMLVAALSTGARTSTAQGGDKPWTLPESNKFAAFLDSYNFAIAKGATAEWRKMEGVALDAKNKKLYIAITAIAKSMADDKGDIKLPENVCGAIMVANLDDNWNITTLEPVVVGGPYDESDKDYPCNKDAIANPDNIFVDGKGNLWIGEDTDLHKNQFLWMWDGKTLKRFASQPSGAEVTGLRVEANGQLFLNMQHPSPDNVYPFNSGTVGAVVGYKAGDDFTPVGIPSRDDALRVVLASGEYQVLARVGDAIPGDSGVQFGQILTAEGKTLTVCNNPDGNMFLPLNSTGTEGYLYTNYECSPGGVSKLYIKQDDKGNWSAVKGEMVDFSSVNGTWNNCNASVTPWNTALTSEEYPADVESEWNEGWLPMVDTMKAHLGKPANPFDYGYTVELIPSGGENGTLGTTVKKHYAMGRFSQEMAIVMPDNKTVYFGDDGTDRILFKFVATEAGDLSAGTLFAAKIEQAADGKLGLKWIELGTGKDDEIAAAIRELDAQYAK